MRRFIKRAVSWLLIAGMVLAEPLQAFADSRPETIEISGDMLDDVPEDGSYVYLGTSSVNITEGNGIFRLPVYRTDVEKKLSVTIRAVSLTADYGKDYTLVGGHKTVGFTDATLMQLIMDSDASEKSSTDTSADYNVRHYEAEYKKASPSDAVSDEEYTLTDLRQTGAYRVDKSEVTEGLEEYNRLKLDAEDSDEDDDASEAELISAAEASDDDADSDKSPLALLKEKQTGQLTRETDDTEYSDPDLTDEIMGSILPEYMDELPFACEQTISFEEGEDTAWLEFRIFDNSKSDGSRMFSLYITDSKNADIYKVRSASVTIEDDEETVHPTLSFSSEVYDASENKADIIIKREGLETSMATADLYAYDISTGTETALGQVAFLPYETEKEITLNVDHEVTLELTNLKAAEYGEIRTAHITGAKRDASEGGLSVLSVEDDSEAADESDDIMLLSDDSENESSEGNAAASLADESSDQSSSKLTFEITLHNEKYEVQYDKAVIENGKIISAPVKGKIYTTDGKYDPPLEVGEYYFSTSKEYGGMYDYSLRDTGDPPYGCGTLEENYTAQNENGAWNSAHGNMKYYHTAMWRKGTVYNEIPSGRSIVTASLYQVIVPDIASTSSFGGGQETYFGFKNSSGRKVVEKNHRGAFSRTLQDSMALRVKKGKNSLELDNYDYISPIATAVDSDWHTPKSYVEYYGFAAIYKAYEVKINNPAAKKFKSFDTTIDAVPVQTEVASGADELYDKQAKLVYVNADEDKSNIVFKLKKNTVNGQDDIFCELKGYTITVGTGNNKCTVNYPEDFKSFINSSDRKTTELMDYSADAKKAELKKLEDIATVSLDSYFIDWIDTVQSEHGIDVRNDSSCLSSQGYYQNLTFTPVVDYIDVNVKITAPVRDGGTPIADSGVSFKSSELKEGSEITYHAGDRLDLTAESKSSQYTVMGYEVSTDGGYSFNTVRNKNELVLLPGNVKGYIIRPCVQANDNCIEITYSGQSQKKVHVDNLIPQSALKENPELIGRYFLDINPEASDPYERMRPEPGKCYSIDIIVDDDSAGSEDKVTRPTVTDTLQNKKYNTNKHYFIAKKNKSDNRFVIGTEKTKKSLISDYTLDGQIVMKSAAIRSSALGYRQVPMIGYTAFTAGPQAVFKDNKTGKEIPYISLVSGVVPEDAGLNLAGIKGAPGDRITIAVDNGINDTQVEEVVLGYSDKESTDIGQLAVTYPITAPYFVSVDYEYDNAANSQKVDHRDNTVRCFDDALTLTAAINPNGRQIEKVVFLVYTATGSIAGTYEAEPKVNTDESVSNSIFEVKIDRMLERFNNGDRIYAYIVDKEKKKLGAGSELGSLPIIYPTMDTGLIMCVENELIKPKELELSYDPEKAVNLPIIGKPALNVASGVLSFTKTRNDDNTMYMLTVNMDGYWSNASALTYAQKRNKFDSYMKSARRVAIGRKMAAAAAMPDGPEATAARNAADELNRVTQADDYDRTHNQPRPQQVAGRVADMTKSGIISVDISVILAWSFVYDAKRNDYIMSSFALTAGGKAQYTKTIYWVVAYIPIYLTLTGSAQIMGTGTWITDGIQNAISEGDFNDTPGNVKDLQGTDFQFNIEGIFIGKAALGAGVQGCVSLRVYGAITLDIDFVSAVGEESKNNLGFLIGCSVGVGIDLLVASGDMDLIKLQMGFGSLENQTRVSFLGGSVDEDDYSKPRLSAANESDGTEYDEDESENAAALQEDGESDEAKITFRSNGMGTNDFSDFAGYDTADGGSWLRGIPKLKDKTVLLNPAAEHTRSRIIQLGKNKQLVVFLGASKVNPEESAVYYTVGCGTEWSEPEAIDDDGTFDTTPDVLQVDDNRILIAWANARESVSDAAKDDDFTSKYKLFKINATFYDIKKDEMGESFTLQDDAAYSGDENRFFNIYPKLSKQGDKIYCTYLKRDVSKAYELGDETRLLDMNGLYSSMAYVTCDLNGENITAEEFINLSTAYDDDGIPIVDPLVTDYRVQTFTLKELKKLASGTNFGSSAEADVEYIAAIYTIDTDGNVKTSTDRYIYLDIYDTTNKKNYYPIKISSYKDSYVGRNGREYKSTDEVTQSSPQLNKFDGGLYATWIEDGHKFVLVDLSETLQTLLATNGVSEFYTGGNTALSSEASLADFNRYRASKSNYSMNELGETNSLLKALKRKLTGGSVDINSSNARTWRLSGSTGWRSNGNGWQETEYSDVSSILKGYYTELYTNAFADTGLNNYSEAEQKELLKDIKSDDFAKDSYDSTVFGTISGADVKRYMIDVAGSGSSSNIGEYRLAYDGTDIYVLYVDACEEPEHIGTELYGMRLRTPSSEDKNQEGGFTKPVMISSDDGEDDYIDEFDVCMDNARNMYVTANSFTVDIDDKGNIINGAVNDNTLMYYGFEPNGSIRVDKSSAEFSDTLVRNETAQLSFNIENHGLFDAEKGYSITLDIVGADKETVIKKGVYKEKSNDLIKAGEQKFIAADWVVPDTDLTDCYMRITASENGYDQESVSYVRLPYEAKISFTDDSISYDGDKITVTADVANIGNAECKNLVLKLFNNRNNTETELQQQYIGKLKSGEERHVEFSFVPTSASFDSLGYINLIVTAVSGEEELDSVYPCIMPNRPIFCELNNGIEKLKLNKGATEQLTAVILPWSSAADSPSYSSSDPTVAYVDENGVIHALKSGSCTISVYYPKLGIGDSLELTVVGDSDNNNNRGTARRDRAETTVPGRGQAVSGEWTLQADGKWSFTGNGRKYAAEWAYIYNPYVKTDQEQYSWFRFDADGNMLTGWYKDTDGKWYYLWEYSDNVLGHMVTGWQYIGGSWYYFSKIQGGPLGSMLTSTKTPDGYLVGADGAWNGRPYEIIFSSFRSEKSN